jgi:very-short-patch-repair endonuclease
MAEAELPDEAQLGLRLPETAARRRAGFDFEAWATAARFAVPENSASLFQRIESAAEAFLLRDLLRVPGALHDGDRVHYHGAVVRVQVPAGPYRVDFALQYEEIRVALEVDGFEFHGSQQAMLRDYQRARRLQLGGFVLVRVTANEATTTPRRCWKDTLGILKVRTSLERLA